jgi:catecholate siderophore receptor
MIKSRKHAAARCNQGFNQQIGAALAVMLLPASMAVQAAETSQPVQQTLGEVKVLGDAINDFKAEKASSPKYTEKLVDTAQTLTVIKRELVEQQGAVTLTEALRNTPGVGAFFLGENGSTTTGDAIYMRGFDASGSIYVDGVRDVGSISRDTFNIEQIDVLKGPAGTDNGRSTPTGSVNLVSKQPTLENAASVALTAGSGQQRRATADLNRVLNAENGTAFRLNLLEQDSGNPARDVVRNKRWAVAPSLAFGLNGSTRVYLNYLHVQQNNIPDGGVLTIGLPGWTPPAPIAATATRPAQRFDFMAGAKPVDPSNFYGSSLDFDAVRADMLTTRIEHDFAGGARLQNTTRYGRTKQDYLLTSFMSSGANLASNVAGSDPSTWMMARTNLTYKDQLNEILTNQSTLSFNLEDGLLKHALVAGLELSNEKQTNYTNVNGAVSVNGSVIGLPPTSIYHPNPATPISKAQVNMVRNGARGDGSTNTQAVYLFDTAKLGERWIFNAGLRLDHYTTSYNGVAVQGTATPQTIPVGTLLATAINGSDTLVNGKLSALYKPTDNSSVYVLAATSKAPPGGNTFTLSNAASSASNPNYDPQVSTTYEAGSKWDLLKQKLTLSAAVYRTDVRNELEVDPTNTAVYYQSGKKRVQGIELGVTGELMRNWLISAGYTRMASEVVSGRIVTNSGENRLSYTPKQALTAWTSYTLPMGLQIGGGARFVDKLLRGTDGAVGTPAYADAYWVYDAMASYALSKHINLRLNLYNLADKQYVAAINKSGYRYTPGAPRSASLTANLSF